MTSGIPYLFLTGFLGSGKTTVLNGLLRRYGDKKIGVIVNDFGDMGIDASLINPDAATGGIRELKAGQIFCSCLAGSFVESVLAYESIKPDIILVECSGLAKPSSLRDITRAISLEAPGAFSYGGMICLIDGERHLILEKSLMVLTEQMSVSDLFMISKTDLLQDQEKKALWDHLESSYPEKPLVEAPFGKFSEDILDLIGGINNSYRDIDGVDFRGWGEKGRPLTFIIRPAPGTAEEIKHRLIPYLGRLYRIKGVWETNDRGLIFFDGTSAGIELKEPPRDAEAGLVVITHDKQLENELKAV